MDDNDMVADALVSGAKRYIDDRIAELEKRLEAKAFRYVGTWEQNRLYSPNEFVTHNGSLWHCAVATCVRPGDGSQSWKMAVKAGRDAAKS